MITADDLSILYSTLSQTQFCPLSTAHEQLLTATHCGSSTVRRLDIACTLSILLSEPLLLPTPALRVNALYSLHALYCTGPAAATEALIETHPFLNTLITAATRNMNEKETRVTVAERYVVVELLAGRSSGGNGIGEQSADDIVRRIESPGTEQNDVRQTLTSPHTLSLLQRLIPYAEELATTVPAISAYPSTRNSCSTADRPDPTIDEALAAAKEIFRIALEESGETNQLFDLLGVEAPLHVPAPDPLPTKMNELMWLNPPLSIHRYEWDHGMTEVDHNSTTTTAQPNTTALSPPSPPSPPTDDLDTTHLHQIFTAALSAPLTLTDQQSLLTALASSRSPTTLLTQTLGLTPPLLPQLVENNPTLATDIILRLLSDDTTTTPTNNNNSVAKPYLDVLVNINMSLHSLEVVNRLATATTPPTATTEAAPAPAPPITPPTTTRLPDDFLRLFVVHCIQTCDRSRDRYIQNRQVRLVCVFLQSLIRNQTISIADFFVEIQAFCIQFSRIREAAGLFRLLKKEALHNNNTTT